MFTLTTPKRIASHQRTAALGALAFVVGATMLAGCTATTVPSAEPVTAGEAAVVVTDENAEYLIASVESRFSSTETVAVEQSLEDLVPSHKFAIDGRKANALAAGIVFGTITAIDPGVAYTVSDTDDLTDIELPFDSADAMWRVAVVTVKVDKGLGGVKGAKTLKLGYVIDGALNLDKMVAGLDKLGSVALVLNDAGKFDFDPSLYSVRWSGALLGLVNSKDEISFPGLGDESDAFVGALDTVDEVVDENVTAQEVVTVDIDHNEFVRSDE